MLANNSTFRLIEEVLRRDVKLKEVSIAHMPCLSNWTSSTIIEPLAAIWMEAESPLHYSCMLLHIALLQ